MERNPSSFRDASGFVFSYDKAVYRWIAPEFYPTFNEFEQSEFYRKLVEKGWILSHRNADVDNMGALSALGSKVILPEQLTVITYPFEWSFSQLKESALLTLDVCLEALNHGFILKDASGFNVQMFRGQPTFIDSLSFVKYVRGQSWAAYRQFISHFLNPLLLMAKVDPGLNQLLRVYLDGIPSRMTSQMLPLVSAFHPIVFMNVHMHSYFEKRYASQAERNQGEITEDSLKNMLTVLKNYIQSLAIKKTETEWAHYYCATNYNRTSADSKTSSVLTLLGKIGSKFSRILDLGSNDGTFSRLVSHLADAVISADVDPLAVESNYIKNARENIQNIYPVRIDFTNPSPDIGWNCKERESFFKRAQCDVVVCLAFIHHMVIAQNIPFEMVAAALASLAPYLIIEFIAEDDSQVVRLFATRSANHTYNAMAFEGAFGSYFKVDEKVLIPESRRTLYRMSRLR